MAKAKRQSKISLTEFRAWLSGVEEMQETDWAPNKTQWDTIRRKIDSVIVEEPVQAVSEYRHPQPAQPAPIHAPHSSLETSGVVAPPVNLSEQGGVGNGLTADIDTSAGEYESSFA